MRIQHQEEEEVVRMTSRRVMVAVERMSMVDDKRGPGRPKGYKHSEETKAKITAKRRERIQLRNTTSGQFVSGSFVKED